MLAIARLLLPLVNVLGDTRTILRGKEMSQRIAANPEFEQGVVYGTRRCTGSEEYYLDLAEGVQTSDQWAGGRHPDGMYR